MGLGVDGIQKIILGNSNRTGYIIDEGNIPLDKDYNSPNRKTFIYDPRNESDSNKTDMPTWSYFIIGMAILFVGVATMEIRRRIKEKRISPDGLSTPVDGFRGGDMTTHSGVEYGLESWRAPSATPSTTATTLAVDTAHQIEIESQGLSHHPRSTVVTTLNNSSS